MNRIRNPCGPHFIRTTFIHHSTQNQTKHEKKSLSTALLALLTASAYAQGGDGIAGITEATSMVTSYFYPLVHHLRHRRRDGTHRRDTCVPEVFVGRPRYVEDRSQLVRRLHLPDSRGNRPRIVLLLMEYGMNKGVGRSVEFRGAHVMVLWQMRR